MYTIPLLINVNQNNSDDIRRFKGDLEQINSAGEGYIVVKKKSRLESDPTGWCSLVIAQKVSVIPYTTNFFGKHSGGNIIVKLEDGRTVTLYDQQKMDEANSAVRLSPEILAELEKNQLYSPGLADDLPFQAEFYKKDDSRDMSSLSYIMKVTEERRKAAEESRKKLQKEEEASRRAAEQHRKEVEQTRERLNDMFEGQSQNTGEQQRPNDFGVLICECGQQIRYPLNKGKIRFTCPNCSRQYTIVS